jgi:Zn-dependent peptidase ImmA (M78 family)
MNAAIVTLVAEIPVKGEVLKWARTFRRLSVQDAAELLGLDAQEVRDYEAERKRPTVTVLNEISAKYQINLAALLMDEPLPPDDRITDFRRTADHAPSIETMVANEDVREALEAFAEISQAKSRIVKKPNLPHASITDDVDKLAARERSRFGVTVDQQRDWPNDAAARRKWRELIERMGIFTYMLDLGQECSGFSVIQDGWAAICVNDDVPSEGHKIFTLFHEYCHLLLRQAGISDENNNNTVERFCNQFASGLLIPEHALRAAIGEVDAPYEFSSDTVRKLAGRFRVSARAMAYRLEDVGLASKGFYGRITGPWELPVQRTKDTTGQPDYRRIQLKKLGLLHMSTVNAAAKQRVINAHDVTVLTGLNQAGLAKVLGDRKK